MLLEVLQSRYPVLTNVSLLLIHLPLQLLPQLLNTHQSRLPLPQLSKTQVCPCSRLLVSLKTFLTKLIQLDRP